jgi:hypothetical protein
MNKCKRFLATCLVLAGGIFSLAGAEANTLRVVQGSHPLDAYAVGALRVALAELDTPYELDVTMEQMTQTRVTEQLRANKLDVMWLASNQEAEDALLPIRFPLLKGLLGYRICIINPANQYKFSAVRTLQDLKALTFGQGYGWPDVDTLRSNGLTVVVTSKYDNLFPMVEGGRFDGFPRGVLEPWVELRTHAALGLTVDTNVLLIYTLPFYLFVSPDNPKLANVLHEGLERALANGNFDRYFYGHEMIKSTLELAKLQDRKAVFYLDNPTLSKQTPLDRTDYWFDIQSLK